jgi:hypothetical protein
MLHGVPVYEPGNKTIFFRGAVKVVYCYAHFKLKYHLSLPPLKVCIYKVGARASGMGARHKFYLVWHLCTNHGAHIFT